VLDNAGTGPGAARNTGVLASTGALLGFLDADDLATPSRIRVQAALLDDPALDAVAGLAGDFSADPGTTGPARRTFTPGTLLLRRTTWDRVGPLDDSLAAGEMVDWVARSRRLGTAWGSHDDLVLLRRVHGANLSGSEAARAGYLDLARAAVRRARGEQT
jgi:glycosyltransferase involved in cell wall biosynthesis